MALRSTQNLTEMSTGNLSGGKGRPAREADLTSIYETIVWRMWEPDVSEPYRPIYGLLQG
jgi:hypothetical protein